MGPVVQASPRTKPVNALFILLPDRCATSGVGEYTIYLAAASVALARRAGFRKVGVHKRHGRLDGEWKDLLIVERLIADALAEED